MKVRSVGLALATYQPAPALFSEQLESIRAQTFRQWTCFITLDSPLAPLKAAPELTPYFEDPRFVWSENEVRLGHKANFERAIQRASLESVDAIGCSDQDDVWYPNKLAISVEALQAAGPLSLVHCDMHMLTDAKISERTVWHIERRGIDHVLPSDLLVRNVVAGCAMLMDVELARRFPRIPPGVEYHDHWYALAASSLGGVHSIRQPLFAYRQHGGNVVGVTPFRGVATLPPKRAPRDLALKCKLCWQKSSTLTKAALQEGITLPSASKAMFLRQDGGAGLLTKGIYHLLDDPPLARACLARAAGKMLSMFS